MFSAKFKKLLEAIRTENPAEVDIFESAWMSALDPAEGECPEERIDDQHENAMDTAWEAGLDAALVGDIFFAAMCEREGDPKWV